MGVGVRVGFVGIAVLAVAIGVSRYDGFNTGGHWRDSRDNNKELTFEVKLLRHRVLGPENQASATILWIIGDTMMGSEKPPKTKWKRSMGRYPPGTYYKLWVRPGTSNAEVSTQSVFVYANETKVCGPLEHGGRPTLSPAMTNGMDLPVCEGVLP